MKLKWHHHEVGHRPGLRLAVVSIWAVREIATASMLFSVGEKQSMAVSVSAAQRHADRSSFSSPLPRAPGDPWAIEFLYTRRLTLMATICFTRVCTCTHTQRILVEVCIDMGRRRNRKRNAHGAGTQWKIHCMKYLALNDGEEGGTYSRQGHQKSGAEGGGSGWERKWLDAIKGRYGKERRGKKKRGNVIDASPGEVWQYERFASQMGCRCCQGSRFYAGSKLQKGPILWRF